MDEDLKMSHKGIPANWRPSGDKGKEFMALRIYLRQQRRKKQEKANQRLRSHG